MEDDTPFNQLGDGQFMSLSTYRDSGDPVPTPVWYARDNGYLYVMTDASSHKVGRIRHNPRVSVAPCTAVGEITGNAVEGMARFLSNGAAKTARKMLRQKYGLQFPVFFGLGKLRGSEHLFIEITPAVN